MPTDPDQQGVERIAAESPPRAVRVHLQSQEGPVAAHRISAATMAKFCDAMDQAFRRAAQSVLTGKNAKSYPDAVRTIDLQLQATKEGSFDAWFLAVMLTSTAEIAGTAEAALSDRAAARLVEDVRRAGSGDLMASKWARRLVRIFPADVTQEYELRAGADVLDRARVTSDRVAEDEVKSTATRSWVREFPVTVSGVHWNPNRVLLCLPTNEEVVCEATLAHTQKAAALGQNPPTMMPVARVTFVPGVGGEKDVYRLLSLWTSEERRERLARAPARLDPADVVRDQRAVLDLLAKHDRGV